VRSTPVALLSIPPTGGVPHHVLEMRNDSSYECARAPANLCVVLEVSRDEKQFTLTAFDPMKGRGKVLRTIPKDPSAYDAPALSPDGTIFALSKPHEPEIHIRLLSLTGGSDREVTVKGWPNVSGLDWASDGKAFYVGSVSPQARNLLFVDLQGNARVLWEHKGLEGTIWGLPSPDGRYLAIRADATNSNVWIAGRLLSAALECGSLLTLRSASFAHGLRADFSLLHC
jgi:hypothetical protein